MEDNKITKWHRTSVPKFVPLKQTQAAAHGVATAECACSTTAEPSRPGPSSPGLSTLGLGGVTPGTEPARVK